MVAKIKELIPLLQKTAPCGEESDYASFLTERLESLGVFDSVETDGFNNVIGLIGGKNKYTLMLEAHYDEVGLVVTEITEEGFLRVLRVGGTDRRAMLSAEVTVNGLCGVVCSVPPHLMRAADAKKVPEYDDLYIDLGLPYEEVKKNVRVGSRVEFVPEYAELLGGKIAAHALDNKASVYIIMTAIEMLKNDILAKNLDVSIAVLFSTQEEIGGYGSKVGAYSVFPDEAIVIDVTFAKQPLVSENALAALGDGVVIERNAFYDKRISRKLIDIAQQKKIKHSVYVEATADGTNGEHMPITRTGVLCAGLSLPLKYMHTPVEVADIKDIESAARLIKEYVREGAFWSC